jgi:glycosyltransferase involved in cell wall biosynthesis
VASRIPGVVDAVAEGVTGLFTDGSASQLATQILLLSNDEVLRKKLGQCGSVYIKENYSSTVVVGLYCDFFQQQFGV